MSLYFFIFYPTISNQNLLGNFAPGNIYHCGYLNIDILVFGALMNSSQIQSTWKSNYMGHWLGSLPGKVENCLEKGDLITKPL